MKVMVEHTVEVNESNGVKEKEKKEKKKLVLGVVPHYL